MQKNYVNDISSDSDSILGFDQTLQDKLKISVGDDLNRLTNYEENANYRNNNYQIP